jgi:hypothetical protein
MKSDVCCETGRALKITNLQTVFAPKPKELGFTAVPEAEAATELTPGSTRPSK